VRHWNTVARLGRWLQAAAVPALLGTQACGESYEGELQAFEDTNLAVVVLDTHDRSIADEPKIEAELRLFAAPVLGLAALTGEPDLVTPIAIETRGYTSQEFPKKQYGFEARAASGEDSDLAVLGLPAEEDWVLHAPFMDKSLMRNALAYELSRRMGHYAPRTRFVELFLLDDGAETPGLGHYRGLYVLTERVERGEERVAIEKLEPEMDQPPELGGGYLLEWTQRSRVKPGELAFSSEHAEALLISYPKSKDVSAAQRAWIEQYVASFEAALGLLEADPDSQAFESYLDVDAAVDFCLLSELLRNHDVFVASTFVHKPRDGRLVLGPLWDLDRAFGDVEFDGNWRSQGWLLPKRGWARELLRSSRFRQRYVERWRMHRSQSLEGAQLSQLIFSLQLELSGAAERNFEKWPILGRYVKANRAPYSATFNQEVEKMSGWLDERAAWIDAHIGEL
jgi:hypothetical protein